jgi:hypothetical protein
MCLLFQNLLNFRHILELFLQRIGKIFSGPKCPLRYAPLWLSQGKRSIYLVYELCFVAWRKSWCPDVKCFTLVVPPRKYKQPVYKTALCDALHTAELNVMQV